MSCALIRQYSASQGFDGERLAFGHTCEPENGVRALFLGFHQHYRAESHGLFHFGRFTQASDSRISAHSPTEIPKPRYARDDMVAGLLTSLWDWVKLRLKVTRGTSGGVGPRARLDVRSVDLELDHS